MQNLSDAAPNCADQASSISVVLWPAASVCIFPEGRRRLTRSPQLDARSRARLVAFERQVSILVRNKTYHTSELIGLNRRVSAYSSSSTTNGLLVVAFRRGMIRDRCRCAVLCAPQLRSDLERRRHNVGARRIVDVASPRRAVVVVQRQIAPERSGRSGLKMKCRSNATITAPLVATIVAALSRRRATKDPWANLGPCSS